MPIPIGVLAVAGAATPADTSSFVLLASTTLTNGTTTLVEFASIPQTGYQHLYFRTSVATNGTAGVSVAMQFNDNTTQAYNSTIAGSYGTANNEYSAADYNRASNFLYSIGDIALIDSEGGNDFTDSEMWIPNYTDSATTNTFVAWNSPTFDSTNWRGGISGGGHENNMALNKVEFSAATAFANNSRFELYGVL